MKTRFLLPLLLCVTVQAGIFAQTAAPDENADEGRNENPAGRYYLWARQAVDEGRWDEALAALQRADDYADVSSDVSFLLAQVLEHEGENRRAVLNALNRAISAGLWARHTAAEAKIMAARYLIALRDYSGALSFLAAVPESADAAVLRLDALKGMLGNSAAAGDISGSAAVRGAEFRKAMLETMDRYPRDPRPLRIFFHYAVGTIPAGEEFPLNAAEDSGAADRYLMELALKRLPLLLELDPELAWLAAPFIRDTNEAFRLVAAYRTGSLAPLSKENFTPAPASIPAALNLGVISDTEAAEEIFGNGAIADNGRVIDRDLIFQAGGLLRGEDGRELFAQKLLVFSGAITADDDQDGFPESSARYAGGALMEYSRDDDQDGITDMFVSFAGGEPQWARVTLLPDQDGKSRSALIHWEKYPAVLRAELDSDVYIPRPGEFRFAPLMFTEMPGSEKYAGLLYPQPETREPRLTRGNLVFYSLQIQRPGAEFAGAVEWTDIDQGIPWRSTEILNGQVVSVTEYEEGIPALRRVDLDLDSRMETTRRFRKTETSSMDGLESRVTVELTESDWNGDGLYEYAEEYLPDGSVVYSWDMDGSGIRNYSETRNGNQNNESEQK